jgi:hypothetical protein
MKSLQSGPAPMRRAGRFPLLPAFVSLMTALCCATYPGAQTAAAENGPVKLDGHVLPGLAAAKIEAAKTAAADSEALALTIVLRRSDQAGFERYLEEVYDSASPQFRRFLTAQQVSDRFGPSHGDYAAVKNYFAAGGFAVVDESANRMTLTVSGTREAAKRSLAVRIEDYTQTGADGSGYAFFANADEPTLPRSIADKVHSITGLSDLARPQRSRVLKPEPPQFVQPNTEAIVKAACTVSSYLTLHFTAADRVTKCNKCVADKIASLANANPCGDPNTATGIDALAAGMSLDIGASKQIASIAGVPPNWIDVDGTGQRIGLLQYDRFDVADVADYLELLALPASMLNQLSQVHIAGGAPAGANESEVLLDIDFVMPVASGANVTVYDAPFTGGGSFQMIFNRMINDGMTIISNSWSYCEDQTTLADVQGIDTIFATAAASGISIFNASGDTGSTCLDGSPNTVGVPSGAPHATAVGGSSQLTEPGTPFLYDTETWWDGSASTPMTGQGGFGVSRFFARPAYQDGFTAAANRSVPDVVALSDPANGIQICQASHGGCPSPLIFGGTSMAAPAWAAYTALLNQAQGSNLGFVNPQLYPLAGTSAFHSAASIGSDFAHVGLGSPNVNALHVALSADTLGPATLETSQAIVQDDELPADGDTPTWVVLILRDANGNTLGGKTVTLSANAGSHAVITPPSATSSAANGAVAFAVVDDTIETVSFVAHDVTDGIDIPVGDTLDVVSPPATSAGIFAFPTTVAADGVSATSITVTLRDAQNQPSPGKHITLSQDGRSVVGGPDPPITDSNGEIVFTATNGVEETVTYTAVDNTDGDLPIPGTAVVTFSGSAAGSCVVPPTSADGFDLTSFANGFAAYPFFYGNVNWGCRGATDAAFDADGNAYVVHFQTGALYKFGPEGGSAVAPLSTNLGPTLSIMAFGRDGRLYGAHGVTTGDFFTGDIVEIDPSTGEILRVVAFPLTCPGSLAVDPLTGDLFFDDVCFGAGSENPSLFRITDPGDTDPDRPTEVTVYATLPKTPNGLIAFAPNGTIYVETGYLDAQPAIVSVTGTDQPQPAIVTPVPDIWSFFWVNVGTTLPNGAAKTLIVLQSGTSGAAADLNLVDITTSPVQVTTLAHDIGSGKIGPDGCLYTATADTVYKIAPSSGGCGFATTNPSPTIVLGPRNVSPNPAQGSVQTLTAEIRNIDLPEGTAVYFQVDGANTQSRMVRSAADGTAVLEYRGLFAGDDVITAFVLDDALTLTSNVARVTWNAGPHATFLRLAGIAGAVVGQSVALRASMVDIAVDPQVAVSAAPIQFSVGGESCSGTTNASGIATCTVTLGHPGAYTLTAAYAGSAEYLPSTESTLFVVPTDGVDLIFADGFESD